MRSFQKSIWHKVVELWTFFKTQKGVIVVTVVNSDHASLFMKQRKRPAIFK